MLMQCFEKFVRFYWEKNIFFTLNEPYEFTRVRNVLGPSCEYASARRLRSE